jgi:phosphate transport system substrate-binding protein
MRAQFPKTMVAVLFAGLSLAANGATAETLRLAGTGGIIEAMQQIAPKFTAASGIQLEVIVGLGSSGALRAIADGKVHVVAAARALTPDEAKGPLVSHPFARTPLVFVTSHPKPNGLKSGDIAAIFAAENPKWQDGTPLKIILRPKVDADTALVERTIPDIAAAILRARQRPDVLVAMTDQDNVNLAQRLDGAFSLAGYGQIVAEQSDLRLVAIDGVMPSLDTLANGTYPYEKIFYLVFARDRNAGAEQLLRFLGSDDGRKALLATGNLPVGE